MLKNNLIFNNFGLVNEAVHTPLNIFLETYKR